MCLKHFICEKNLTFKFCQNSGKFNGIERNSADVYGNSAELNGIKLNSTELNGIQQNLVKVSRI